MNLLVGLGNPGNQYRNNRHNVGFMVIDEIREKFKGSPWRSRFQGEFSEITIDAEKTLLLKPSTYMNESGRSVGDIMRFFKLTIGHVFVFHDELDVPHATVRIKKGGGNAGHNGLKSISAHCGNDFMRIRIGIGHPGEKYLVSPHVLSDFSKEEFIKIENICKICTDNLPIIFVDFMRFQTKFNSTS